MYLMVSISSVHNIPTDFNLKLIWGNESFSSPPTSVVVVVVVVVESSCDSSLMTVKLNMTYDTSQVHTVSPIILFFKYIF